MKFRMRPKRRMMSLVICFLLIASEHIESYAEQADAFKVKFTNFTENCPDDIQKALNHNLKQLKFRVQDLNYKLNTLSLIVDQLFEELSTALEEIPRKNLLKTNSTVPATSNKQEDAIHIPTDCRGLETGTHLIQIPNLELKPFSVYCQADPQLGSGDSWIVIQRRRSGSVNFNRNWNDYEKGFGNLEDEFFIGLQKLHALTCSTLHELWIQVENHWNETGWARYNRFAIGDENESYALNVLGNYSGIAGDGLDFQAGQRFTTEDVDNDEQESGNCATTLQGGWWYKDCSGSNLNGKYFAVDLEMTKTPTGQSRIKWTDGMNYLKYVHMAIRSINSF